MVDSKKLSTTFGVITDCQYTDEEDEVYSIPSSAGLVYSCSYRDSPNRLSNAMKFFNSQTLDFVIHLGDFIDRHTEESIKLLKITKRSRVPFLHVIGNHEYKDKSSSIERVKQLYNMPARYYSKEVNNYKFIIIDSNELGIISCKQGTEEWKKGSELLKSMRRQGLPNAFPWNGGVGDIQLKWIDQQILDAKLKGQYVILFSHHPIFPSGPLNMLNDNKLLSLIDKYDNVKVFLNGHNHLGNYGERNGIPYITLSGLVEGEGDAYGVVSLSNEKGTLDGFGRQASYSWPS